MVIGCADLNGTSNICSLPPTHSSIVVGAHPGREQMGPGSDMMLESYPLRSLMVSKNDSA